jgi:hypothetical protein
MQKNEGYMYDEPYAPAGMGREFINAPDVRKPLSEFVGASEEFNLGAYFGGATEFEPWDPWSLSKLSKVSANNPDVAWLREAELKHGRIAMLAFVGILITAGDVHFGASTFSDAADAGWPLALGSIQKSSPGIFFQGLGAIAIVEGVSNNNQARNGAWWDGLWFGEREGSVVAGDLGWDPLKLMPKDPVAAKKMQLKELKNGRLAMLAVIVTTAATQPTTPRDLTTTLTHPRPRPRPRAVRGVVVGVAVRTAREPTGVRTPRRALSTAASLPSSVSHCLCALCGVGRASSRDTSTRASTPSLRQNRSHTGGGAAPLAVRGGASSVRRMRAPAYTPPRASGPRAHTVVSMVHAAYMLLSRAGVAP